MSSYTASTTSYHPNHSTTTHQIPSTLEAKIVVLGTQGVGKTSLVHRFIHNTPPSSSTPSTIGASFLTKRLLDPDTSTLVRLQIWDTAGQERFRSISRLYYRGANACIICYDITSLSSFTEMGRWLTELRREVGEGVVIHVVGTKSDLVAEHPERREVPFERCIAYVAENLYPTLGSTPPPTAGGDLSSSGGAAGLLGGRSLDHKLSASSPAAGFFDNVQRRPQTEGRDALGARSKRSSGFWGQDVGWDCCHEISAESGEGVEEVFRVVTRKLVEQARKGEEGGGATPGFMNGLRSPEMGGEGRDGYFEGANPRGSFRVGRDRMSWLGFPTPHFGAGAPTNEVHEAVQEQVKKKKSGKCC